jgi:hypothetical protein
LPSLPCGPFLLWIFFSSFSCWILNSELGTCLALPLSYIINLYSFLKTNNDKLNPFPLWDCQTVTLLLPSSCHLLGPSWLHWAYLDNPGVFPYFYGQLISHFSSICSLNSLLPCMAKFTMYGKFPRFQWHFLGVRGRCHYFGFHIINLAFLVYETLLTSMKELRWLLVWWKSLYN